MLAGRDRSVMVDAGNVTVPWAVDVKAGGVYVVVYEKDSDVLDQLNPQQ